MSAVLLVFVIALINLMLGLYLGIQLGYGPPDLATTSRMLFDGTGKSGLDTFQTPGSSSFEDEEGEEAESWSIESLAEEDDELSDEASESLRRIDRKRSRKRRPGIGQFRRHGRLDP